MTTETTPKKSAKSQAKGNKLHLTALEGETDKESIARSLFNTPMQATITINNYLEKHFDAGLTELGVALQRQVAQVNKGDMKNVEGLLTAQAYTLDAIFHRLARRAQYQEDMGYFEQFLKLALRAQNQCRATLETLSTIKNPPNVAFVKQANIANNQQINNGALAGPPAAGPPPAIDSTPQLEHTNGNYLDTRTATARRVDNPPVETLGEVHRSEDRRG